MARFADRRRPRAATARLMLTMALACAACLSDETPVVLDLTLAQGLPAAPDRVEISVRDAARRVLFSRRRVPDSGSIRPISETELGSVVLYPEHWTGTLVIEVVGLRAGDPVARGDGRVVPRRRASVFVTIQLAPIADAPPEASDRGDSLGVSCSQDEACGPRLRCVDGVCCDGACDGVCMRCDLPQTRGRCSPSPAGVDPDRECRGVEACDGSGRCAPACVNDAACGSFEFCLEGACQARRTLGDRCAPDALDPTGSHQCAFGPCIDGRCCRQTCSSCFACTGPGGTCEPATLDPGCGGNAGGSGGQTMPPAPDDSDDPPDDPPEAPSEEEPEDSPRRSRP